MSLLIVALIVLGVGVSLGASGYGGFLVAVALVGVMGMDARDAVAHGLVSFLVPGLIGVYLYWRNGVRPGWSVVFLLAAGTIPGTWIGRHLSMSVDDRTLQMMFGTIVVVAGLLPLAGTTRRLSAPPDPSQRVTRALVPVIITAGLLGGIATVVAGVGGPLITVPILLAAGMELTPVVGASLVNAIVAAALGTWSLSGVADIDPTVLVIVTAAQLAGVPIGVYIHRMVAPSRLIRFVAAASIAAGLWLTIEPLRNGLT